jgi:hypothetical protein
VLFFHSDLFSRAIGGGLFLLESLGAFSSKEKSKNV